MGYESKNRSVEDRLVCEVENSREKMVFLKESIAICLENIIENEEKAKRIEKILIKGTERRAAAVRLALVAFMIAASSAAACLLSFGRYKAAVLTAVSAAIIATILFLLVGNGVRGKLKNLEGELCNCKKARCELELNLAEARAALEKERKKTAELEAETEKLKSETGQC